MGYFRRVGIALSILLNVILGGSPYQTLSARNYERKRAGKWHLVPVIDFIFYYCGHIRNFFLTILSKEAIVVPSSHHCLHSWAIWRTRKDIIHEKCGEDYDGKRKEPARNIRFQGQAQ